MVWSSTLTHKLILASGADIQHPPAGSPVDKPLVPLSTNLSPGVACCLTVGARPNLPATRKAVVEATMICSQKPHSQSLSLSLSAAFPSA